LFALHEAPVFAWEDWLVRNSRLIHQLEEHRVLLEQVRGDSGLAPLVNSYVGATTHSILIEAHRITDRLVWRCGRNGFSLADFETLFQAWDAQLRKQNVELVSLIPLLGFKAPAPITLNDEVTIAPLSEDEICHLLQLGVRLSNQKQAGDGSCWLSTPPFAIRIVHTVRRTVESDPTPPVNANPWYDTELRAEAVLTALRVYKGGTLSPSGHAIRHTSWPFEGTSEDGQLREFPGTTTHLGLGYTLSEDEARLLPAFVESFELATSNGRVAPAARRFAYAFDRVRLEDRVLDIVIALEGLLLSRREDEKTQRLATRGSYVARGFGRRDVVTTFLRHAYDVRSAVAHGDEINPNRVRNLKDARCSMPEFAQCLEELARYVLRKAMDYTCRNGTFLDEAGWRRVQPDESRLASRSGSRKGRGRRWNHHPRAARPAT
jgi:hypothetical protein